MLKDKPGYSKSFIISVAIHVVFFTALFTTMSLNTPSEPIKVNLAKEPAIVKAKVVDMRAAQAEELQRQKLAQEQLLAQQRLEEQQRAEQLKAEQQKAEQLKAEQLKQEAEKVKQAETLKQQKLQKEAEAKAVAAKKVAAQKAEQQKQLAAQKEADTKAKQAAAAKELAAKQAADKQAAAAKAAAMKAEQDRLSALHQEFLLTEVEKYRAEIQATIEDNRILSGVFVGDICCKIRIKLLPDGSILSATVVESSGNKAYDDMSVVAVSKSAPFTMPQDQELYNQLRDIVLSFKNGDQTTDVF